MPDVFGMPQDKAANTASKLGSRYNADTAWSALGTTPSWQLGTDRFAQYSQHLPRRRQGQVALSLDSGDISTSVPQNSSLRFDTSSGMDPAGIMRMAQNFPTGIANTILNPVQNLAGKFMA